MEIFRGLIEEATRKHFSPKVYVPINTEGYKETVRVAFITQTLKPNILFRNSKNHANYLLVMIRIGFQSDFITLVKKIHKYFLRSILSGTS